ncbi:MAG TPA: helix-turn-helix domain-containing protein [Gammaproteobacteria bacterium]|nr:helix-turn-helix domain-containing protein [Gammaproteobacteria bacterium]
MDAEGQQEDAAAAPESGGAAAVGAQLAAARKKAQLSVDAVAGSLHLTVEVVRALEAGDERGLPGIAFVRGYVKSYARLLGLDEAALTARLPAIEEQQPRALRRVGMKAGRRRRRPKLGKGLLWLLLLAVVIALVVWGAPQLETLWSRHREAAPVVQEDRLPLPQFDEGYAGSEDSGSGDEAAPAEPVAEDGPGVAESAGGPPAAADSDSEAAVAPAPAVMPAEEAPGQKEEDTAGAGPAVIRMHFREDSWVEMDANGRKLVVGNQRAGSERTVRAEPPIHILLGNAPGVELSYRGKPVDLAPYSRGKVARLTLED